METLRSNGVTIEGAKMTLIGTGGASAAICTQAAVDACGKSRCSGLRTTFESGRRLAERLNESTECKVEVLELSDEELLRKHVAQSDVLGNATPVGMGKMEGKSR